MSFPPRFILRGVLAALALVLMLVWVNMAKPLSPNEVPVACYRELKLVNGVPEGWSIVRKAGTPKIKVMKVGDVYFFHLESDARSGFGIERPINVDIREYRYINWTWRAMRLPEGGDIRRPGADDQALQIYIALSPLGFPQKLNTPVLTYLWDNEAPKGTVVKSSSPLTKYVRYLIVRNGDDELGRWITEKRNIYEDYKALFRDVKNGEPPGPTQGIRIYINSQHTGSSAEGYIGNIYFSRN
ncbi:MAG TPA: DUF3047 domain-containing protein [Syntrophales bacterium]|nr:DUF3047 domain-containing protein [Syntrophales bacterium]HOL59633.1 DUF3047 domain-containing protein [Syntrophales bacterium]HPO35779.1 DUF3047 domain-containing protein [Syntrophales bacterium]